MGRHETNSMRFRLSKHKILQKYHHTLSRLAESEKNDLNMLYDSNGYRIRDSNSNQQEKLENKDS